MRLFVAIELVEPARGEVLRVHERLVEIVARQGVRFVRAEKLHMTLAFLGEVEGGSLESLQAALSALEGFLPFNLELAGVGGFPDLRRPKVIWLGAKGDVDVASSLTQSVSQACKPYAPNMDEKPFAPHITLARVKPGSKEVGRLLQSLNMAIAPEALPVRSFSLIHSKPGGEYETLHTVQLHG